MALAWVAFPLMLVLAGWGAGGILVRAADRALSGALRVSLGLGLVVVVGNVLIAVGGLAGLVTPATLVLALLGVAVAPAPWRPEPWTLAAGLVAFAVFAAPIVLSGHASFAGYIKLDDTATWLNLMDRAMSDGRSVAGLAPSSYQLTFSDYAVAGAYPFGWFVPLGALRALVGQDGAWLFAPYLATLAGVIGAVLSEQTRGILRVGVARAAAGAAGGASTLLLGYALWGGIKEIAAAWALVTVAAAATALPRNDGRVRSVLPLAVALGALIAVLSAGAGAWEGPLAVGEIGVIAVAWRRRRPWTGVWLRAAVLIALTLVVALPALSRLGTFLPSVGNLTKGGGLQNDLGNLLHPLGLEQVSGVWLSGDFRAWPTSPLNGVLVTVVLLAALGGLATAIRRRCWPVATYPLVALAGLVLMKAVGGPWLVGKALAIASPAAPFLAMTAAGVLALGAGWRRPLGLVLALLVGAGVLVSDGLAYRSVYLAPRARLAELEHVGRLVAGRGPTLLSEEEVYGSRHLLRAGDPTGASDLRPYVIPLQGGGDLIKDGYADLDSFRLGGVEGFRSIVVRRSPTESRPPAIYRRAWAGRYYELWQRPVSPPERIVSHLPLGDVGQRPACGTVQNGGQEGSLGPCAVQPASVPSCTQVSQMGAIAAQNRGHLVAFAQPHSLVVAPQGLSLPAPWLSYPGSELVAPTGPGTATGSVALGTAGRQEVWLGGSFNRQVDVAIDGRKVGSVSDELSNRGQYLSLGVRELGAGPHTVAITAHGATLAPGSGYLGQTMGDLIIKPPTDLSAPLISLPATQWRALCGRSLDWIEALAP